MKINCSAFANNKTVPIEQLFEEGNLSPVIQIADVPEGAASLAIVLNDPDAPINGLNKPPGDFTHWIFYNLPPTLVEIPGGIEANERIGVQALNDFGNPQYDGPCPPPEHGPHRYQLILYALDSMLLMDGKSGRPEFETMIKGRKILAQAMTVGTFESKRSPSSEGSAKPFNKVLCNWLTNDLQGLLKKHKLAIENCGIAPDDFGILIRLHHNGILTKAETRNQLEKWLIAVKGQL